MKWLANFKFKCFQEAYALHIQEIHENGQYSKRLEEEITVLRRKLEEALRKIEWNKKSHLSEMEMICRGWERSPADIRARTDIISQLKEENEKLTRRCVSYMKAFDAQMWMHARLLEGKKE